MPGVFPKTGELMWLAEYDVDVYNAPEVFSVPPLTRLILPVMSGHNWHCTNRRLSLNDNWPQRGVLCSIPRERWYSLPRFLHKSNCFRFFGFQVEWHLRKLINGASTRFLHFDNHQGVGWRDVDIVRSSIYWVFGRSHKLNNFSVLIFVYTVIWLLFGYERKSAACIL